MKKIIAVLFTFVLLLSSTVTVFAAEGKVTYSGNAGNFIFEPGSAYSPTDLFPDFKGVMPGDTLTQKITVKNDADNPVKVKIYMRALGAHENSREFLSRLALRVQKSDGNEMGYMFDAAASETAQLTDWVCLGTLYSGGQVDLDVLLDVPTALGNEFQDQVGYLDWEFMIEEFPVEDTDPKPPHTGMDLNTGLWLGLMFGSLLILTVLLLWRKKDKRKRSAT